MFTQENKQSDNAVIKSPQKMLSVIAKYESN